MNELPDPPVNVQLELTNGRLIPTECRYVGLDSSGIRIWQTVLTIRLDYLRGIRFDEIPPRTVVQVSVRG